MPVKLSFSDLSETHDRLKREAQQYLDSLSGETVISSIASSAEVCRRTKDDSSLAPVQNVVSLEEEDSVLSHRLYKTSEPSKRHQDDNSHSTTASEASDDDLPEMTFHQSSSNHSCGLSYNDDDSLLAMAQRLDDASVISYSSFEVRDLHSHVCNDEDRSVLDLPCSTNSSGHNTRRVTKFNSNLEKSAIAEDFALESDSVAARKGRRRRKLHRERKSHHDGVNTVDNQSLKLDSAKNSQEPQPAWSMEERHVSKTKVSKEKSDGKISREKRMDAKRAENTQEQANSAYDNDRNKADGYAAGQTIYASESKTTDGKKFYSVEKKNAPKISQWKDLDHAQLQSKNINKIHDRNTTKSKQFNDSEYTIRTNNKNNNSKSRRSSYGKRLNIASPKTEKKTLMSAHKYRHDSDDESMHGVGCNVRLHDKKETKTNRESSHSSTSRSRSNSKTRRDGGKHTVPHRSRSTPPALKDVKPKTLSPVDTVNKSDDEANSAYNSDCNTEFFYESTDDDGFFSQGEEDLPAVGTSVLKAVEDLNSKSAVCKMKNLLGIRS